ncbi:cobyric acid synthase [Sneathiella chinensis]|uniref:Cobyric acid synthase n=1 Tax=Sneathiella chinensis TaxID=349750 RepID=A0ABQ5U4H4_9PROT|nr:cobyric acid synthase [Sneathiella chinensis]GLQ06174.1 cobyric acid synthase [Sneathiella chinensis]
MAPHPKALMIQGTGSDVGKSLLVAGMARALSNRGLRVMPFKPQNMSNNAAVTSEGGEIGRAQALQARAARTPLLNDMNPVLLKPQTDVGAQVIVQGQMVGNVKARQYQDLKHTLLDRVLESFHRLAGSADIVLIEGAGSPAEVNLRKNDIANMGFAEAADIPVILTGDIDRGGVIAQLVGTYSLLSGSEKNRTKGYLVNKFRGDVSLFDDGLTIITEQTGMETMGVVPFFNDASKLPPEDAASLPARKRGGDAVRIAIPVLSRIANFDDFDPLFAEPSVQVEMIRPGTPIPAGMDVIILPGSKATLADMIFLRDQGWDIDIHAHVRQGGTLVGICGGYQMLGRRLHDPDGIEGSLREVEGLGLLDFTTTLTGSKKLLMEGGTETLSGTSVQGYHMHVGECTGPALKAPFLQLESGSDGAISKDRRVMGCYLHGLFANDAFRHAFLHRTGSDAPLLDSFDAGVEQALDDLAAHLEAHTRIDRMLEIAERIR